MIKKFPALAADIFYINVGTEEQRKDLLKQAWDEHARNPKTVPLSNKGCWRSHFEYQNMGWLQDVIKQMVNEAGMYYQESDQMYKRKAKVFASSEIQYWTNINEPGSLNRIHDHRLWQYVAVYYLQATGTGDIVFYNPVNITESCNHFSPFVGPVSISPKDGDLLVFPAWLPHEVEVNTSNQHRINISMNIRFHPKPGFEDAQNNIL
jgi:uncharacterized protein (TIGR02466 family)